MNKEILESILNDIKYKDWQISIVQENDILFIQPYFKNYCACRSLDDEFEHYCRKWRISIRMTKSEIVQTAFLAILTAEEHEIRENFKYKGRAIFGPHFDIDKLVEIYDNKNWDMRINSIKIK